MKVAYLEDGMFWVLADSLCVSFLFLLCTRPLLWPPVTVPVIMNMFFLSVDLRRFSSLWNRLRTLWPVLVTRFLMVYMQDIAEREDGGSLLQTDHTLEYYLRKASMAGVSLLIGVIISSNWSSHHTGQGLQKALEYSQLWWSHFHSYGRTWHEQLS